MLRETFAYRLNEKNILAIRMRIFVAAACMRNIYGLTYQNRAKWKMLWGIYSAIYGEVNVSVEKYVEIKGDKLKNSKVLLFLSP